MTWVAGNMKEWRRDDEQVSGNMSINLTSGSVYSGTSRRKDLIELTDKYSCHQNKHFKRQIT